MGTCLLQKLCLCMIAESILSLVVLVLKELSWN